MDETRENGAAGGGAVDLQATRMTKVGRLDEFEVKGYALLDEASGRLWGPDGLVEDAADAPVFDTRQAAVNWGHWMGLADHEEHEPPVVVELPFTNPDVKV